MRIILAFTGYFGGFGSSLRGKMRRDAKITSCPTALAAIMFARFIDCITVGSRRNLGVGRRPPHRFPAERNERRHRIFRRSKHYPAGCDRKHRMVDDASELETLSAIRTPEPNGGNASTPERRPYCRGNAFPCDSSATLDNGLARPANG